MDVRKLLIAAVLLAVLSGAAYWASKQPEKKDANAAPDAPKLLDVTADQVQQVDIRKKGAPVETVRRDGGKWQISAPEPMAADQEAVNGMVTSLAPLTAERLVDDKPSDLSPFGLATPAEEVDIVQKGGKTQKLLIGDTVPTTGSFYAKLAGDPRVFTIASFTKTAIDKLPADLQDKRLLTFDPEKLSRVELTAKKETIEFGKNAQNDWQILKPRPLRADGGQVESVVQKLRELRFDPNNDQKTSSAAFGSGSPVADVKVTDASGTQNLTIHKKDNDYYAKSSVRTGAYKIAADTATALDKGLDDFRNRKLFDFGFNDPERIEIHDSGKTYTFTRTGDKWSSNGREMDVVSVMNLTDKLRDLAAAKFAEGTMPAPTTEIDVTSSAGKRVEKLHIAPQGDHFVAQREAEPSLYELDAKAVKDTVQAAADVKESKPAKK